MPDPTGTWDGGSVVFANARAFAAVLNRDFRIMRSYRTRFVTHLISIFFTLTLFHFVSRLVNVSTFPTHDSYYAYVVVGLITLQVLNSTLAAPPGTVRQELVAGTFERLLVSPFGAVRGILATLVFPFAYALVVALTMLAFAGLLFGVDVRWSSLGLVVPVGILGALSFAPFGIIFLSAVLVAKQGVPGVGFIVGAISLVSGLYFPISLLPGWVQAVSNVQPFTPAVDLMRHVMVGTPLRQELWIELIKLAGFTGVLLPISLGLLVIALRVSRSRGTVLEY